MGRPLNGTFINQEMLDDAIKLVGDRQIDLINHFNISRHDLRMNVKENNLKYEVYKHKSKFHDDINQEQLDVIIAQHGATLEKLSIYFGITPERVRQLCAARGLIRPRKVNQKELQKEIRQNIPKPPQHHRKANNKSKSQSGNKLYHIYNNIINRCYNPRHSQFHNFGAQGIVMSDEFRNDFTKFADYLKDDMGYFDLKEKDPTIFLTRINNKKSYERGNLIFMSASESSKRLRISHKSKIS